MACAPRRRALSRRPRLRRAAAHPLSRALALGLLAACACLLLFAILARAISVSPPIIAFDQALTHELHARTIGPALAVYRGISLLGMEGVALLTLAACAVCLWRRRWRDLGLWTGAVAGGFILNNVLKLLFARPRPVMLNPTVMEQTFSFPSGHAMMSLIAWGLLALLLCRRRHTQRPALHLLIVAAAALLIVLVGISRLALGAHFLTDVVAGFAAGAVWLAACVWLYTRRSPG